jgi:hypothetical protein
VTGTTSPSADDDVVLSYAAPAIGWETSFRVSFTCRTMVAPLSGLIWR